MASGLIIFQIILLGLKLKCHSKITVAECTGPLGKIKEMFWILEWHCQSNLAPNSQSTIPINNFPHFFLHSPPPIIQISNQMQTPQCEYRIHGQSSADQVQNVQVGDT
jgi:hypothetical protein